MRVESEKTLDLFRGPGPCELCLRHFPRREAHHAFIKRGMGGGSRLDLPENLAGLCAACHHKVENSHAKALLVQVEVVYRMVPGTRSGQVRGVTVGDFREWLDLVLRTPKGSKLPRKPWETPDAPKDEAGPVRRDGHREGAGQDGVPRPVPPVGPEHRSTGLAFDEAGGWLAY